MTFIDLTMPLNSELPVYPGDPKPGFPRLAEIAKQGYNEYGLQINTHCGTHIDAPWHMVEGAKKLKDFPINKFAGEAILLDARGQKEINVDVSQVKKGDNVIIRTGHTSKRDEADYFKTNPVLSKEVAWKLVEKKINLLGIDSFSPDNSPFPIHKILLENDILILENLVNLEKITSKRFKLHSFPLKLENDGAPCRAVAEV